MKLELAVIAGTYGAYMADLQVHLFAIVAPILILKYVKDLDLKARVFIVAVLAWNIIDVLNNAIDTGLKNDAEYKCMSTVSTSKDAPTEERPSQESLIGKDLMSNSSKPRMDE